MKGLREGGIPQYQFKKNSCRDALSYYFEGTVSDKWICHIISLVNSLFFLDFLINSSLFLDKLLQSLAPANG